jgi:hypothetical protein
MFPAIETWSSDRPRSCERGYDASALNWRAWLELVRAVVRGERCDVLAGEQGLTTFLTALVIVMFAVLLGLVANVANNARQKMEVQNSADAIASSSSLWQARGMNAVTAANHLSGELAALCALQYSFGGPELDDGKGFDTAESRKLFLQLQALATAADALAKLPTYKETWDQIKQTNNDKFKAGATIYDSFMTLEYLFFYSLAAHDLGGIVYFIPFIGPFVDLALEGIAAALDVKILQEWVSLENVVQPAAQATIPARKTIETGVLPLIQGYADMATRETALSIERTVKDLSQKNNVKGAVYPAPKPATLKLPLEKEHVPATTGQVPDSPSEAGGISGAVGDILNWLDYAKSFRDWLNSIPGFDMPAKAGGSLDIASPPSSPVPTKGWPGNPSRDKLPKSDWNKEQKSQWVRATYPWVNHWRAPIRSVMDGGLTLSMASAWYLHWSNRYTLAKTHEFRTQQNQRLTMYVMIDSEKHGKGNEPWTRAAGSARADELFCVVGFAHQPVRTLAMPRVFGKPPSNSKGMVAFSQAMLYNANQQGPLTGSGGLQPDLGWNTLNWKSPVRDGSHAYEYGQGVDDSDEPVIHLNWQTKLTPVTRLFNEPAILQALPAEHRDVLTPLQAVPGKKILMNH